MLGCQTDGLRQAELPLSALSLWEAKPSLLRLSGNRANGEVDGAELTPESLRGYGVETGCREDCSAGEKAAGARGRIQPLQTEAAVGAAAREMGWHRKACCRRVTHAAPAAPFSPHLRDKVLCSRLKAEMCC